MNESEDVAHDHAALFHRADDRGEIVVGDDDVSGILRDVCPANAHGNADVSGLECRRIVHTIARHCHNCALLLQRTHDLQLVFRSDPCEHGCVSDDLLPTAVVQSSKLFRVNNPHCGATHADVKAELVRNFRCGGQLIAGDHDHAYAGRTAAVNRRFHAVAEWVDHAGESDKRHVVREAADVFAVGIRQRSKGESENA